LHGKELDFKSSPGGSFCRVMVWQHGFRFMREDRPIRYLTKESRRFSMFLEDLNLTGMLTFAFFPVYKASILTLTPLTLTMLKVYWALSICFLLTIAFQPLSAQKIYFTESGSVKRMNLDGSVTQTIVTGTNYHYIAVDGDQGFLFYNDSQESFRAFLNGSSPAAVTDDGPFAGYTNIAAVPDYESLIYVGISDDQEEIYMGSYYDSPPTNPTEIITGIVMVGDTEYNDVAYNKSNEQIYFTSLDNGLVYSCNLDGTGANTLITSESYGPIGVDYINSKIYWVRNTGPNYFIMSASLTGASPTLVLANGNIPIESLEVYPEQNAVFFTQDNGIFRTTLAGPSKTPLYTGSGIRNLAVDFDITPPVFYILSPTDNGINASITGNLSLTFNENIQRSVATSGTADDNSIRIYETTGDVLVETIDRSSSNISIAGTVVTIDPSTLLDYNKSYYVLAGNKVFSDLTDNNWVGITLTTGWNFATEPNPSQFYSRQNGNWNNSNTWSHVGHTGPPATNTPGTGHDVVVGNGHTVTLTGNTTVVGNSPAGTWIQSGATLDAALNEFHVWGTLRIDGQLVNGGILSGMFELYASGGIPVFDEIQYGVSGYSGAICNLYTNIIALNGIQSIDGGVLNLNGYEICTPPAPPPTSPLFSNKTNNSVTLSWTTGGGNAFVVARQGSTSFKPGFGLAYTANAAFGAGSQVGTGNYVVYSGTGNSVTITGLTAATNYEFDLYSFNNSIGGCYNVNNYQPAFATSCVLIPAPANPINSEYCTGDTKPAINVNSPGSGRNIRWYDSATGGTLVPGDGTGGDGRGGVFIPTATSGTFYAETYDGTLQCSSSTRTAVTLTQHPPLVPGTPPSTTQSVCSGGDPTVIDGGAASGGTGIYTYQWEKSTAAGGPYSAIIGAMQSTYDPPAGITQTTYYHRLTRSATCLQPGNPVVVTITAPPVITVQPTPQQACDGKSATFSIDATGTPLATQWQVSTGSSFANITNGGVYSGAGSKQLQISNVAGLDGFRYQCIVSIAGSCPVTSTAVPLTLVSNPVVNHQQKSVCEGLAGSGIASVDLTALNGAITGGTAGLTVGWFTNQLATNPVSNPSNASANNNTIFYAKVSNSNGCSSVARATIEVSKKPTGNGTISGPLTICTDTQSTFTVNGISGANTYNWQVTAGLQIISQTGTTASIRAVSGANATISVMGENSCGTGGSASRTIQLLTSPEVQIIAPSEVIIGEPASFAYESSSTFQTILWNFGDTETSIETSPQHLYLTEGSYQVTLNVVDEFNCSNTDDATVAVLSIPELSETNIKNVITANGDSRNGLLYIQNLEKYPSNQVVLLDRWGVEVFKKENYENDWDARRNGEFLPAGQYVCIVKLNETGKIYSRTVSIIKRK
jgi:gliding motility-associated-like protein